MTPSYMPMDRGDGMDQFGRPMDSQLGSYTTGQIDQLRFNRPVTGGGFVGNLALAIQNFKTFLTEMCQQHMEIQSVHL